MAKKHKAAAVLALVTSEHDEPVRVETYFHCGKCLDEWQESFRGILSPRDYARTQAGLRKNGTLQVVCTRHNCNIAVLEARVA